MGNEEHGSTVERFLEYANLWNNGKVEIKSPSYVLEHENVAIVMASPDFGRDFNDSGIAWMVTQIEASIQNRSCWWFMEPRWGSIQRGQTRGSSTQALPM